MSSGTERGFGPGFEKDVKAILDVAERGILYMREVRENLAKAGMIISEEVDLPLVNPPVFISDEEPEDELQLIGNAFADELAEDEEAVNE